MKSLAALAITLLLAGCWQSKTDFYSNTATVTPFRTGKLSSQNKDGDKGQSILTLARGQYRLTNDDRSDSDFGDSFTIRFFPLPGAPPGVLAYAAQDNCKPADRSCDRLLRYYGLARATARGAEVLNPDCPKPGILGAKADSYGTCDFASRALLEKALVTLARSAWKPDIVYSYD